MPKKYAIIVAGGSGTRMQNPLPKQFMLLGGVPLLFHTITTFKRAIKDITVILVLPAKQTAYWKQLCKEYHFTEKVSITSGGDTRFHSVSNGLKQVNGKGIVAIHDGVRPLVSGRLIHRTFAAAQKKGNAIPAIPVKETMRLVTGAHSETVDRSRYVLIQTPQCFDTDLIKKAYRQPYLPHFTDDAGVLENTGKKIHFVEGDYGNIKITTPFDFEVAEALLK